jgi:hypothetical protein
MPNHPVLDRALEAARASHPGIGEAPRDPMAGEQQRAPIGVAEHEAPDDRGEPGHGDLALERVVGQRDHLNVDELDAVAAGEPLV